MRSGRHKLLTNQKRGTSIPLETTLSKSTPEIFPGKERPCCRRGCWKQKPVQSLKEDTQVAPAGTHLLHPKPPSLGSEVVIFAMRTATMMTFFFFLVILGGSHLDFPLLWFSLCFRNLEAPGWSGFRQAAASAGSHSPCAHGGNVA